MISVSKTYTDFIKKIALTIPEQFIDVKTGNSYQVSEKMLEQIEYHANNSTLNHLVFSALHDYMKSKSTNVSTNLILKELSTIKKLIKQGNFSENHPPKRQYPTRSKNSLDMDEVEDVLEAFGG